MYKRSVISDLPSQYDVSDVQSVKSSVKNVKCVGKVENKGNMVVMWRNLELKTKNKIINLIRYLILISNIHRVLNAVLCFFGGGG